MKNVNYKSRTPSTKIAGSMNENSYQTHTLCLLTKIIRSKKSFKILIFRLHFQTLKQILNSEV